jgi:hypothetical protein
MNNTRKIILTLRTGHAGRGTNEGWIVPDNLTDDELWVLADERAVENAESYGIYRLGEGEEASGDYSGENIEGSWKEYDENKHAGCISFGTCGPKFQEYT